MHQAITAQYKDNLEFIKRQDNLRPNIFDKKFAADFRRIYTNNDTGIKQGTINQAQD